MLNIKNMCKHQALFNQTELQCIHSWQMNCFVLCSFDLSSQRDFQYFTETKLSKSLYRYFMQKATTATFPNYIAYVKCPLWQSIARIE